MDKKENKPSLEYKITNVIIDRFNYNSLTKIFKPEPGESLVNYNIVPNAGFIVDKNEAVVTISINGSIKSTNEEFVNISVRFIFEVKNLKDFVEEVGGKITFMEKSNEKNLLASIVGVSYSTMRGILITKGAGTILQTELLPVLDPNIFFKSKSEDK